MVSTQDHFTYKVKKIRLQNVVAGIPSLNHVKNQSKHDKAHRKVQDLTLALDRRRTDWNSLITKLACKNKQPKQTIEPTNE